MTRAAAPSHLLPRPTSIILHVSCTGSRLSSEHSPTREKWEQETGTGRGANHRTTHCLQQLHINQNLESPSPPASPGNASDRDRSSTPSGRRIPADASGQWWLSEARNRSSHYSRAGGQRTLTAIFIPLQGTSHSPTSLEVAPFYYTFYGPYQLPGPAGPQVISHPPWSDTQKTPLLTSPSHSHSSTATGRPLGPLEKIIWPFSVSRPPFVKCSGPALCKPRRAFRILERDSLSPPKSLLRSFPVSSFYSMTYTPPSCPYFPQDILSSLSYLLPLHPRLLLFMRHGITAAIFLSLRRRL